MHRRPEDLLLLKFAEDPARQKDRKDISFTRSRTECRQQAEGNADPKGLSSSRIFPQVHKDNKEAVIAGQHVRHNENVILLALL